MLVRSRSSRLIPGRRAIPAVITTTSDPAVSSYPLLPVIFASVPMTGADSSMSNDLPWGRSSTTSTRTTSVYPNPWILWAVVAPTLPAPTTVTLLRICDCSYGLKLAVPLKSPQAISQKDGFGDFRGSCPRRLGCAPLLIRYSFWCTQNPGHYTSEPKTVIPLFESRNLVNS